MPVQLASRLQTWGGQVVREGREKLGCTFWEAAQDQAFREKMAKSKSGGPNRKSLANFCRAIQMIHNGEDQVRNEAVPPGLRDNHDAPVGEVMPLGTVKKQKQARAFVCPE